MSTNTSLITTAKPFRLLDLPPEIRTKIFTHLCTSPEAYMPLCVPPDPFSELPPSYFPHSLLLSCSQLYHELRPLYFSINAFSLTVQRHNQWACFFSPDFFDNRRAIHTLQIVVLRWGTKDFFRHKLVPVLEDMVMNGKLRDIEVVVKQGFCCNVGRLGSLVKNWRALRKLLTDPYLERVKLVMGRVESWCSTDPEEVALRNEKDITWMLTDASYMSY